jgi:hypothetical protein
MGRNQSDIPERHRTTASYVFIRWALRLQGTDLIGRKSCIESCCNTCEFKPRCCNIKRRVSECDYGECVEKVERGNDISVSRHATHLGQNERGAAVVGYM